MANQTLVPVSGVIQRITPLSGDCCSLQVSIVNNSGVSNFIVSPSTQIMTSNGQRFNCSLEGQLLIVYYSAATMSIPPQTTPRRIIVVC